MNQNVSQQQPVYIQPQAKTSGFAVTALVTGIVGLVFSWVPGLDIVLAAVAIVFGALGWHYASTKGLAGKGMAIAGMVMGIVTAAVFVILIAALGNA